MSRTPLTDKQAKRYKQVKRPDGSLRLGIVFDRDACPPRTKQSRAAECDIRNILRTYKKLGRDPETEFPGWGPNMFQDTTGVVDYHTALSAVRKAESAFADLPSEIRDRFKNDPGIFFDWAEDPANEEEAVRLGLARKSASVVPSTRPGEGKEDPKDAPKSDSRKGKGAPAAKTPSATDDGGQPKGGSKAPTQEGEGQ